ncbi:MAG: hypothetical protein RLZZ435_3368 [Cyanobacteriota bacterium]|jgi:hypothetical protein
MGADKLVLPDSCAIVTGKGQKVIRIDDGKISSWTPIFGFNLPINVNDPIGLAGGA